ncbi:MAG: HAD family phosphatase, partial [Paraburkholderia sp.]|uniref:HAD family hydrolase n=1 Tax=Paraburkholderia sp. TaxID=1926495 RepID=UPI003C4CA0CF
MTQNIKAVLWDMDGTLADTEALHLATLVGVLAHHGIEAGQELHPVIFGKTAHEVYMLCAERFGIAMDYEQWSVFRARHYLTHAPTIQARSGALGVYRAACDAGKGRAIVSNSSRMLLEANLRALNLQDPALVSVSVNDVRRGKPDPEAYLRAAYLLGVSPAEAVVVEDSPVGAAAALAAGMRALAWP